METVMRYGLRILLHLYDFDEVAARVPMHIVAAEQDASRFRDGSTTGLISVRRRDASILRAYETELLA